MKRLLVLAAFVAAVTVMGTTTQAGVRFSFGSNHGYGGYHHQNYHAPRYSYRNHGPVRHNTWHDTGHYDYHPGGFVRHRNHYDYIPGHYDYHQTGHWDTHYHR